MMTSDITWECSCGHTEYQGSEPEECMKCGIVGGFIQMPQELIEERERELIEDKEEKKSVKTKTKARKKK